MFFLQIKNFPFKIQFEKNLYQTRQPERQKFWYGQKYKYHTFASNPNGNERP